MKKILTNNIDI